MQDAAKILSRIETIEAMAHTLLEEAYRAKRDLAHFYAPAPKGGKKGGLSLERRKQFIAEYEMRVKKQAIKKAVATNNGF